MHRRALVAFGISAAWAASLCAAHWMGRRTAAPEETPTPATESRAQPAPRAAPEAERALQDNAPTEEARIPANQFLRELGPQPNGPASSEPVFSARHPEALRRALQNNDPILRATAFSRILEQLNAENIEAAVREFESLPPGFDREREFSLLLYAWGRIDGGGAMAYLEEMGDTLRMRRGRGMAAFSAVSGWASTDPEGALAWIRSQPSEEGNDPLMLGVINGVAARDLHKASEILYGMPLGWARNRAADIVIDHYLQQGTGFTTRWAENLPAGEARSGILSRVADRLASVDPATSADWVLSLSEGEERAEAFSSLVQQWSRRDPVEAAAWVETLSNPELKAQGYQTIVDGYLRRRDYAGATAFVNERQPGPTLDPAISRLAQSLRRSDPAAALGWAASVTDTAQRFALMDGIVRDWKQRDPEAASAFLENRR